MKHFFTRLLSILFLCAISISAMAQEAYAVMSKDSTTLTFYYDNKKASRKGTVFGLNTGDNKPKWVKVIMNFIWDITASENFTMVVFDSSFKNARPISCAHWFDGFKNLKKIEGIENLNTSNVTDMSCMFWRCESLTSLDVSNFNTSNVTYMGLMFSGCENLTSLDVSNFNTSNVTYMLWMFDGCKNLKTIYVGDGWNTSKVEKSEGMFDDCTNLVGENGTKYNPKMVSVEYARIDGGKDNPGYFTHSYKIKNYK